MEITHPGLSIDPAYGVSRVLSHLPGLSKDVFLQIIKAYKIESGPSVGSVEKKIWTYLILWI